MNLSAHQYAENATGSFVLPETCFQMKALMDDESSTIADIANVISVDPDLTSRLLKIANSAIYRFQGRISTISRAITIVGTEAIYQMMLVDFAANAFNHFGNSVIDIKRFWRLSVYTGLVCKNLAFQAGIKDIERLFVVGLLHNLGELIVAKQTPDIAQQAQRFNPPCFPWEQQQAVLGFTYTDVTAELLQLWQLPNNIILPIRHYHEAKSIDINKDVKVLYLASRMALLHLFPDRYTEDDLVEFALCQKLGITSDDLSVAIEFAENETDGILSMMNAKMFG
jgi:HD-like signal output (HDOD) protein